MAQELYKLPEGWSWKKFQDVCQLKRGYDLPKKSRIEGKHPLFSANGVTDYINQWKVKGPGVVTGRSGTIGKVHFVYADYWPLNTALYVEDFKGNDERFIYFFLESFDLNRFSSGAAVPTLNRNSLSAETVCIPDTIDEQKRIVAKLDALFTRIDAAITHLQETLELSKALFASALHGAFNPKGYESDLPLGWSWKKFKDVCQLKRGYDLPKKSRVEGAFPLFSANGVTDYIDQYMVSAPGVVTGRSGTIGKVHFVETDYWPLNTALYVEDFHGNDERFIHYFLTVFDLTRFASGAAVPTLNRNSLSAEDVCVPDTVDDQRRIVTHLDALTEHTRTLEAETQARLDQLSALKSSLLDAAFRGQL